MNSTSQVNVIGYASATIGLGVIAREFAKALLARGHSVAMFDLDAGAGRSGRDLSLVEHFVPSPEQLPPGLNVWVLDAPSLLTAARRIAGDSALAGRFHAAFVWWELPGIPADWVAAAEVFDAVVTGSEYVREIWAGYVTRVPVLMARTPLDMPDGVSADRQRFGFKDDEVVVFTGFEALSDPARKNPFAAIDAFLRTPAAGTQARLVVKVNHADAAGPAAKLLQRLDALVASDPRIKLLRDKLDNQALLSLYSSTDIAMSLHRAEGLGLMPLEAMRLGKPVVATGWSGNLTYMNHASAALVRYSFCAPEETAAIYSPAQLGFASRWAEPSVDHAAQWLEQLISDPVLRRSMGERAKRSSQEYDTQARKLEVVGELFAIRESSSLTTEVERSRLAARADQLARARADARLPPLERKIRALSRLYGRHLGWRLRRVGQ